MRIRLPSLVLAVVVAAAAEAQEVSMEFFPNPAPPGPGVPITFTGTDATGQGLWLGSSCTWFQIHQGAPDGPIVPLGIFCPAVLIQIDPNGSWSFVWDQTDDTGAVVAPDTYWLEISVFDSTLTQTFQSLACISIQDPAAPRLDNNTAAKVGSTLDMTISAPALPGAQYFAAASLTSDNPIQIPGSSLSCLDVDVLFGQAFPTPNPTFFSGFQGTLDGAGQATGVQVHVPALPGLAFQSLKVQAILVGPGGFEATNGLSFTIDP